MPAETIILVHGLWMTGIEMTMLRHRLQHSLAGVGRRAWG